MTTSEKTNELRESNRTEARGAPRPRGFEGWRIRLLDLERAIEGGGELVALDIVHEMLEGFDDVQEQDAFSPPYPASKTMQIDEKVTNDIEVKWRDLALQFDGHRIEALSMLHYAVHHIEEYATVRDILREPLGKLKAFLRAPPLSGEDVLAKRIEALRTQPNTVIEAGEVTVKPLEWVEEVSGTWWVADAYRVETFDGGGFAARVSEPQSRVFRTLSFGVSFEAAKKAAQDHFETRIRSALSPNGETDEMVERLMAHAQIEWSYHEDNNRYPRDFWHIRVTILGLSDGWVAYGEQEQRDLPDTTKLAAENEQLSYLRSTLRSALSPSATGGK